MNNRNYRVIFSKAKNMLVVVSEATRSQGKASNASVGGSEPSQVTADSQTKGVINIPYGKFASLSAGVLLSLGLASTSYATEIYADKSANTSHQATVLKANNGVVQVDVQTPSDAGVSRNVYSKFNVSQKGVILNNSRNDNQSKLGGWVKGNPWLKKGEARVILNEVNSTNPSLLNGYTEIAGKRAELVIANPAGITCSGCGFINASRTTLATGNTIMNNGSLTGFEVSQGNISVNGKGLNDKGSSYTTIISKTAKINADIHANNLDTILGSNTVGYNSNSVQSKNVSGTGVALDVSQLGGMYAGKIRLIGTDKGMGVTNLGNINSNTTLTLDTEGNLINKGSITAKNSLKISNEDYQTNNSGKLVSSTDKLTIASENVKNSGVINSYDTTQILKSDSINNSGLMSSGQILINTPSLKNTGTIQQKGSGGLSIKSNSLENSNQAVIGQQLYKDKATTTVTPDDVGNTETTTPTNTTTPLVGDNTSSTPTGDVASPVQPSLQAITASGYINAANLSNSGKNAKVSANSNIEVNAKNVTNKSKASIGVNQLLNKSSGTNTLNNSNSRIQLDSINWKLRSLTNKQGTITSKAGIDISSTSGVNNAEGTLVAPESININSSVLNNTQGSIDSKKSLSLNIQSRVDNTGGNISSKDDLTINASQLTNSQGVITTDSELTANTDSISNSGQIYAGQGTNVSAKQTINNSGLIGSGQSTSITAANITNSGDFAAGANTGGLLSSNPFDLKIQATNNLNSSGKHTASGDIDMQATNTDLTDSVTSAQNVKMQSSTDLVTSRATVTATNTLTLATDAAIVNKQGKLTANKLDLKAHRLNNKEGSISQTGTSDLTLSMLAGIDNTSGSISTNSDVFSINTSTLNNKSGSIQHAGSGSMSLDVTDVDNSSGKLLSGGTQTITSSSNINNAEGTIQGKNLDITATALDNNQGIISASLLGVTGTNSNVNITGDINNTKGVIVSNTGSMAITGKKITNESGNIRSSTDNVDITSENLDNTNKGSIYAGKNLSIKNEQLLNNQADIAAKDKVTIESATLTQGSSGKVISGLNLDGSIAGNNADLSITTTGKQSNSGSNLATGNLSFTASELDLQNSKNEANSLDITASSGSINHTSASTIITEAANIKASGDIINDNALLKANAFDFAAQNFSNNGAESKVTSVLASKFNINGDINNTLGLIQGKSLDIAAKDINNSQGAILTSAGDLTLDTTNINNAGDKAIIQSDGLLTINNKEMLTNTDKASISAKGNGDITSKNIDNNQESGIASEGSLALTVSETINNNGGIASKNDSITINSNKLNNGATGIINGNSSVTIMNSSDLTNKGNIYAEEKLDVTTDGELINDLGQMFGGEVALTSKKSISNKKGLIAQSDSSKTLTVTASETIDNQGSKADVNSTDTLGIIANGVATLNSQNLNNAGGEIAFAKDATIEATGNLNNQQGSITSQTSLTVKDVNKNLTIDNQSGKIEANSIDVTAKNYLNSQGAIKADTLTIAVADSIVHDASSALEANTLTLKTDGDFTNSDTLTGQNVTVEATNITNQNGAKIVSSEITKLEANNTLNNYGLINGSKTYLKSNIVNNEAGGKIYGDHIAIQATTLNNTPNKANASDSNYTVPVIAARQRLDLGVTTLNNNANYDRRYEFNDDFDGQAQIISNGDMHIGGSLDGSYQAIGKANTINNTGATIESMGNMFITAGTVNNNNANFVKDTKTTTENKHEFAKDTHIGTRRYNRGDIRYETYDDAYDDYMVDRPSMECDEISGFSGFVNGGNGKLSGSMCSNSKGVVVINSTNKTLGDNGMEYHEFKYDKVTKTDVTRYSDAARITAGTNMTINADSVTNDHSQFGMGGNYTITGTSLNNKTTDRKKIISVQNGTRDEFGFSFEDYSWIDPRDDHWARSKVSVGYSPADIDKSGNVKLKILNAPIQNVSSTHTQGATTNLVNVANSLDKLAAALKDAQDKDKNVDPSKIPTSVIDNLNNIDKSHLTPAQKATLEQLLATNKNGQSIDQAKLNTLIGSIGKSVDDLSQEVRVLDNDIKIPNSALFSSNPDSSAKYLVETDPNFTNLDNWLSSDYMLKKLSFDPAITQKRIGDGYYEQKLIREQLMALTGNRFLEGQNDEQSQFKKLMNSGINVSGSLQLRPGIALTKEQMQMLTKDIVWMVEKTVTLKDGTTQKVLTPQVYTAQLKSAIDGTGALITANNVKLDMKGDVNNQGTIAAKNSLEIDANNLTNDSGTIQGGDIDITTKKDLHNKGGKIKAENDMELTVGGNLINETTTYTTNSKVGKNTSERTGIANIGSIEVGKGLTRKIDSEGNLVVDNMRINVTNNIVLKGGKIKNSGGSTNIKSKKGDIKLEAVKVGFKNDYDNSSNAKVVQFINNKKNFSKSSEKKEFAIGSSISGIGDVTLEGKEITGTAVHLNSENGTLKLDADENIDFKEGRQIHDKSSEKTRVKANEKKNFESERARQGRITGNKVVIESGEVDKLGKVTKSGNINLQGTSVSGRESTDITATDNVVMTAARNTVEASYESSGKKSGILSSSDYKNKVKMEKDTTGKASIYGNKLSIKAGKDIKATGMTIIGYKGASLEAGNEVTLAAAENTSHTSMSKESSKKGLSFGDDGAGVFAGYQDSEKNSSTDTKTHKGTVLGTIDGNISIKAKQYTQIGSQLSASSETAGDNTKGNIRIEAEKVNVEDVVGYTKTKGDERTRKGGITAKIDSVIADTVIEELKERVFTEDEDTTDEDMMSSISDYVAGADDEMSKEASAKATELKEEREGAEEEPNKAEKALEYVDYATKAADIVSELANIKDTKAKISVGYQQTNKRNSHYKEKSTRSGFSANNLTIIAKGAGTDSNIDLRSADFDIKNNAMLDAENKINMTENVLKETKVREEDSFGGSIGGSIGAKGFGVDASINGSTEDSRINKKTHVQSDVNIGNKLTIKSGGDTDIKGVAVNAKSVSADVGGNLNIKSLQDTSDHKFYKLGGELGGSTSGEVNLSADVRGISSNYKGVKKRAGLFAGDGGFDVKVDGKTTLTGAAITSTDKAQKAGLNKFESAGGVESNLLLNTAEQYGGGLSVSVSSETEKNKETNKKKRSADIGDVGVGFVGGEKMSITQSGITGVTTRHEVPLLGWTGDSSLTTDNQASKTNVITEFDGEKAENRLDKKMNAVSTVYKAGKAAKDAHKSYKDNKKEKKEAQEKRVADKAAAVKRIQEVANNRTKKKIASAVKSLVPKKDSSTSNSGSSSTAKKPNNNFTGAVKTLVKQSSNSKPKKRPEIAIRKVPLKKSDITKKIQSGVKEAVNVNKLKTDKMLKSSGNKVATKTKVESNATKKTIAIRDIPLKKTDTTKKLKLNAKKVINVNTVTPERTTILGFNEKGKVVKTARKVNSVIKAVDKVSNTGFELYKSGDELIEAHQEGYTVDEQEETKPTKISMPTRSELLLNGQPNSSVDNPSLEF